MQLSVDDKGQGNLKAIHHFEKRCGDSMCVKKNPYTLSNPRHGHRWCSGSDISAQGRAHAHPGLTPMQATLPVQIPNRSPNNKEPESCAVTIRGGCNNEMRLSIKDVSQYESGARTLDLRGLVCM